MTTIYNIRNNLLQIIAGKEQLLNDYNKAVNLSIDPLDVGKWMAATATIEYLKINIAELKRILQDVEVCCEQASARAWQGYLDRQAGI